MVSRRFIQILTTGVLLAASTAACSLFNRAAERVGLDPAGTQIPPAERRNGGSGGQAGEENESTDLTEGLQALESYRASFTVTIDGAGSDGSPVSGKIEMLHEINRRRQQDHVRYHFEGAFATAYPTGELGSFQSYTSGAASYLAFGSSDAPGCARVAAGQDLPSVSGIVSSADLLAGLVNPRLQKRGEMVNGTLADRYTFRKAAFPFGAVEDAKGVYWLAVDGGYIVQLTASGEGQSSLFGTAVNGKYTIEYNLRDQGVDFEISLPVECTSQAPGDLPIPPSATGQNFSTGMTTYTTPQSAGEVAAFYRAEMPARGWIAGDENTVGTITILNFTWESRKIAVTIQEDGPGGTSVLISESD